MQPKVNNMVLKFGLYLFFLTVTYQDETLVKLKSETSCIKEYQLCRPGDNCCNGLSCSEDQCLKPCEQNKPCKSNAECCGKNVICYDGICDRDCYDEGSDCELLKDMCCDGVCTDGKCVSTKCSLVHQKCEPGTQPCCIDDFNVCYNRTCVPSCKEDGEACDRSGKIYINRCCGAFFCSVKEQCNICKIYGQECHSDEECCFFDDPLIPINCIQGECRRPCFSEGNKCKDKYDCCSNTCTKGVCSKPCSTEAQPCKIKSDCCNSSAVCGEKNLCQKASPCGKLHNKCSSNQDCCLSFCKDGSCKMPCSLKDEKCITNNDCCDEGYCFDNTCQHKGCIKTGLNCKDDDDCCSKNCERQTCQYTCVPNGKTCKTSDECCSKICNSNTCCVPNSKPCVFNEECCDKNCENGVCVYKCSPEGGTCSTAADCCFSGLCVKGRCGKKCYPNGYDCSKATDCCSGNCKEFICVDSESC